MINFFRKIRRELAYQGKVQKYLRYAFGEVFLIMLGIFMALQLQDWNENRKKEQAFKLTLERLYNTVNSDIESMNGNIAGLEGQITNIDYILEYPDSLNEYVIPYVLHSLYMNNINFYTESAYYADKLVFNNEDQQQVTLSKQIIAYITNIESFESQVDNRVTELVLSHNIPIGKVDQENAIGGIVYDTAYYSVDQRKRAKKLLHSEEYQSALKTIRTRTVFERSTLYMINSEAQALIRSIKKSYPGVRLIYEDVGIIGTSIDGFDEDGAISTPMTQSSINENVWEVQIPLTEGEVKFRCRDSWAQNWGGISFPEGEALSFGPNIRVDQKGIYHISLDLGENTYTFSRIEAE